MPKTNAAALTILALTIVAPACASDEAAEKPTPTAVAESGAPPPKSVPVRAPTEARFQNARYALRFPANWQVRAIDEDQVKITNAQGLDITLRTPAEWTCHRAETMALVDEMAAQAQPPDAPPLPLSISESAPPMQMAGRNVEGVQYRLGEAPGYTLTGYVLCPLGRADSASGALPGALVVVVQGSAPVVEANLAGVRGMLKSLTVNGPSTGPGASGAPR